MGDHANNIEREILGAEMKQKYYELLKEIYCLEEIVISSQEQLDILNRGPKKLLACKE